MELEERVMRQKLDELSRKVVSQKFDGISECGYTPPDLNEKPYYIRRNGKNEYFTLEGAVAHLEELVRQYSTTERNQDVLHGGENGGLG